MKFTSEIEIKDEHLDVLLDYLFEKYDLDDEYFNLFDRQDTEHEMLNGGLLQGGFYQHYPLYPTDLGNFILHCYRKSKEYENREHKKRKN